MSGPENLPKNKRVDLIRQVHQGLALKMLSSPTIPDCIKITVDRFNTYSCACIRACPRDGRTKRMLDTGVYGTQRCLLGHNDTIGAQRYKCSGAHTLSWHNDFKVVAEHMKKINQIPCCRRIAARSVKNQRYLVYRPDFIQMIDKQINDVLTNHRFQPLAVSRYIENSLGVTFRFNLSQQLLSFFDSRH